jgi:hypothetical protein
MDLKQIADNYSIEKRKMMTDAVIKNKNHTKNFTSYHAESLTLMFAEWHLLFPANKQDMKCSSCRKAVVKFWETMVDEWIIVAQTPKSTKKSNVSKNKKTKAKQD